MEDAFPSAGLSLSEEKLRAPEEPAETLPGSPDLRDLAHPEIGSWRKFRATLKPKYWRAWAEISFSLGMLLGGYAAHFGLAWNFGNLAGIVAAPVFAAWLGFWLNAILTFGHEAAHYNLSASKSRNDLLADWSIWLFFPQSSKSYRKSHWQHHLHLGDPQDTEISYHNCASPWFLTRALTGIYLLELMARYTQGAGTKPKLQGAQNSPGRGGPARADSGGGQGEHYPRCIDRCAPVFPLFFDVRDLAGGGSTCVSVFGDGPATPRTPRRGRALRHKLPRSGSRASQSDVW
jgi:Fatty acid desaturase